MGRKTAARGAPGGATVALRRRWAGAIAAGLCLLLLGCGKAEVTGQRDIAGPPVTRPVIVYIADFELDTAAIQSEPGVLPRPQLPHGPLGGVLLARRPGAPKDPATRARELVDLMARSLAQDLNAAGTPARRLAPGEPPPPSGWLVRGVFTDVNEGNRLRRALIGFGQGQTELQLVIAIDDLKAGVPQPFYQLDTSADSGKAPGAAITLNPYMAAARFVMSGSDLDRNVRETAQKAAAEATARAAR
jgi:hypothetical protein